MFVIQILTALVLLYLKLFLELLCRCDEILQGTVALQFQETGKGSDQKGKQSQSR